MCLLSVFALVDMCDNMAWGNFIVVVVVVVVVVSMFRQQSGL